MAELLAAGNVRKMKTDLVAPVSYALPLGDQQLDINPLLGQHLQMQFEGVINCIHCARKTSKSFSQGYCYPCFRTPGAM